MPPPSQRGHAQSGPNNPPQSVNKPGGNDMAPPSGQPNENV